MHQISPRQTASALTPVSAFREVADHAGLFGMLLRNDLRAKFRHSMLGVFWLFIPPVAILLLYVYVFSVIFQIRWPATDFSSRWGFGLTIYAGITVYSAFSDSVMGSLNLLVSRAGMLKRVPYPYALFPVSWVCTNMLISGIVLWILFALSLATGGQGSPWVIFTFPLIYLPFGLLTVGAAWTVAALGVFFRDLGNVLGILLLLLFFATPTFYSMEMLPKHLASLIACNPLTAVIQNIRRIFLFHLPPEWRSVALLWFFGILIFQAGYWLFSRLGRRFADVV